MKKFLSVMLAIVLILQATVFGSFATYAASWDSGRDKVLRKQNMEWDFRPPADYVCEQNPPDFSWPYIKEARTYDLKICRDKEMQEIAYEAVDITTNFYNFPEPFEPGIYYWSARYKAGGELSEWLQPSRFRIAPDAGTFYVDDINTMLSKLAGTKHPRLVLNQTTVPIYREVAKGVGADQYNRMKKQVEELLKTEPLGQEPDSASQATLYGTTRYLSMMKFGGLIYQCEGNQEIADWAVKALLDIASWDHNGWSRYSVQDQHYRNYLNALVFGYDSFGHLLTDAQKQMVLDSIQYRMLYLKDPPDGLQDDATAVKASPYQSHGWSAVHYLLNAALVTYGEIPESEEILKEYLPLWINLTPPWTNEDGGWGNGMGYAAYSMYDACDIAITLHSFGMCNIYDKAQFRNNWKLPLYNLGLTTGVFWGDEAYGATNGNWDVCLKVIAQTPSAGSGYISWMMDRFNTKLLVLYQCFTMEYFGQFETKAPIDVLRSAYFKDTGWVAMHSDLMDMEGRTSLYFKSSPYGSYNHSHADQNSFTVSAFGENLAVEGGYYDAMWTEHWWNYYKQTQAHNSITMNNGDGQGILLRSATGKITNFLIHPDFDLTTGDATAAYNVKANKDSGYAYADVKAEKMKRHIIYVRPDTFVIVDDLKGVEGAKNTYEWWIHSSDKLSMYNSKTGLKISKGNAALDLKVQYPKVDGHYTNLFSNTDLKNWQPNAPYAQKKAQKGVWFSTKPTEYTKIVTTMSTHKTDETTPYVDSKVEDGVLQLFFEDGTIAYIRLSESGEIHTDGIQTDGTAIVKKQETVMAVDATTVTIDGKEIFHSDQPISVIWGKEELGISADTDANITLSIGRITSVVNEKGTEIIPNTASYGVSWDNTEGGIRASVQKGFYTYYLNGKTLPGASAEDEMMCYQTKDGVQEITLRGYYNHDGAKVLSGTLDNAAGFYRVKDIRNINLKNGAKQGEVVKLAKNESVYSTGESPYLYLENAMNEEPFEAVKTEEHESLKEQCAVWQEAENYYENYGGGSVYTTRKFLSGSAGISGFNADGDVMKWKIKVPVSGYYDLVIKYVAWGGENGVIQRIYSFNDSIGLLNLPATDNYGQDEKNWIASRMKTHIYLEEGEQILTIYPQLGSWNFDWIGLIPSDR